MTAAVSSTAGESFVRSADGTTIGYRTVGSGQGSVIVLGGALRSGEDYLALAHVLASSLTVHVVDRRGRGLSGPQGPAYAIERECEDLLAVQEATGADAAFGHSFGGLVALETARRSDAFTRLAVYEPGVSIAGSIATGWVGPARERLQAGDARGAFTCMVRGTGFAPAALTRMPFRYVDLVLRLAVRGERWQRMAALLEPNLAEHVIVERLDDGSLERFGSIAARTLLLGGGRSPRVLTTDLLPALAATIPDATVDILDGLDHLAPDEKNPQRVAERLLDFFARG